MTFPLVVMALPPVDVPQPEPILVTAVCSPRVPELSYRNLLLPLPPVMLVEPIISDAEAEIVQDDPNVHETVFTVIDELANSVFVILADGNV
jgi:hypothetical protein